MRTKEEIKEYNKKYYLANKKKAKEKMKEYYKANKKEIREQQKEYYQSHEEEIKESSRNYRKENPEKRRETNRKYSQDHKEERNKYVGNKKETDPHFKLRGNVGSLINKRLKKRNSKKDGPMAEYLPYTIKELKDHLENQFTRGMTWENYGKWHLDHILPDSSFNYTSTTDEEFKKCWALENLQPLWAIDNILKGNKI